MRQWLRDPRKRGYLTLALGALILIGLLAPLVVARDARHLTAYGDGGEDISSARRILEPKAADVVAILATPTALRDVEDPSRALYVALGSERAYDDDEADAVVDFLERGGSVLLADEGGFGTAVAYAAGFVFEPQRILDSRGHLGNVSFPIVNAHVSAGDTTSYRVVMNLPAKLTPLPNLVGDYETLASTSNAEFPNGSYVDEDENGVIDVGEAPGPFPLIVRAQVQKGTLILLADTGIFMNAQMALTEYENDDYLAALASSLVPSDGTIFIDESRHVPPASIASWNEALRAMGRVTSGGMTPFILLGVLVLAAGLAWRFTRETEDWSHHGFNVGHPNPTPESVKPDHARLQRLARRLVSERYNIPLEQVAAMTTDELQQVTHDRTLAEAASGDLRSDPSPLFVAYAPAPRSPPVEVQP